MLTPNEGGLFLLPFQEVSSEVFSGGGDGEAAGARRTQLAILGVHQVPLILPVDRQCAHKSLRQAEAHIQKTQEAKVVADTAALAAATAAAAKTLPVHKVASPPRPTQATPPADPSPTTGGSVSVANRASSYTLAVGVASRRASAEVVRRGNSMELGGARRFSVEGSSSGDEAVWPEKGPAVMEKFPMDDHEVPLFLKGEAVEWRAVQFNTKGGGKPIIVKCGATSKLKLVVKSAVEKGAGGGVQCH